MFTLDFIKHCQLSLKATFAVLAAVLFSFILRAHKGAVHKCTCFLVMANPVMFGVCFYIQCELNVHLSWIITNFLPCTYLQTTGLDGQTVAVGILEERVWMSWLQIGLGYVYQLSGDCSCSELSLRQKKTVTRCWTNNRVLLKVCDVKVLSRPWKINNFSPFTFPFS